MNLFDGIRQTAFSVVTTTMGYPVSWQPLAGGPPLTAQVLFNDASETARLLEIEYDPQRAMMEYQQGDLAGLKASVDVKNDEIVIINGVSFGVNEIRAKFDGNTYIAQLQQV